MRSVAASGVIFAAMTALVAYLGYLKMFTGFASYDDEGYMLVSLRSFISGQALYDHVVMQYGPFYFEVFGFIGKLGVSFDLDSGRLVTLVIWLAIALLSGVAVFVFTRSLALGLGTQLITFATASTLTTEPMHPGAVALLLVIGIEAAALITAGRGPGRWTFALIGGLTSAAILTKVNVGVFAAVSIVFACVLAFPALARIWPLRLIVAAGFLVLPFLLMKSDLGQAWALQYATHVAVCAGALVMVTSTFRAKATLRIAQLGWLLAAGASLALVVVVIAFATGTSPTGLLQGMLLDPLHQSQAFEIPIQLPDSTVNWDAAGLGGAALWTVYRLRVKRPWVAAEGVIRILAGLFIWLSLLGGIHIPGLFDLSSLNSRFVASLVFAWIVAAARGGPAGFEKPEFARVLVAALAILQSLHAYPVASSQVAFSLLTVIPVGAICIGDGLAQVSAARVRREVATSLLFVLIMASWLPPAWDQIRGSYASSVALGLPGASRVRVPADQAALLRQVTQAVRDKCDTFISVPGLDSFYIFGPFQPPTPPTRWMWLDKDVVHQQAAVDSSNRVARLCVIENDELVQLWTRGAPAPDGPLTEFISRAFVPLQSFGTTSVYTVLVRPS